MPRHIDLHPDYRTFESMRTGNIVEAFCSAACFTACEPRTTGSHFRTNVDGPLAKRARSENTPDANCQEHDEYPIDGDFPRGYQIQSHCIQMRVAEVAVGIAFQSRQFRDPAETRTTMGRGFVTQVHERGKVRGHRFHDSVVARAGSEGRVSSPVGYRLLPAQFAGAKGGRFMSF